MTDKMNEIKARKEAQVKAKKVYIHGRRARKLHPHWHSAEIVTPHRVSFLSVLSSVPVTTISKCLPDQTA